MNQNKKQNHHWECPFASKNKKKTHKNTWKFHIVPCLTIQVCFLFFAEKQRHDSQSGKVSLSFSCFSSARCACSRPQCVEWLWRFIDVSGFECWMLDIDKPRCQSNLSYKNRSPKQNQDQLQTQENGSIKSQKVYEKNMMQLFGQLISWHLFTQKLFCFCSTIFLIPFYIQKIHGFSFRATDRLRGAQLVADPRLQLVLVKRTGLVERSEDLNPKAGRNKKTHRVNSLVISNIVQHGEKNYVDLRVWLFWWRETVRNVIKRLFVKAKLMCSFTMWSPSWFNYILPEDSFSGNFYTNIVFQSISTISAIWTISSSLCFRLVVFRGAHTSQAEPLIGGSHFWPRLRCLAASRVNCILYMPKTFLMAPILWVAPWQERETLDTFPM